MKILLFRLPKRARENAASFHRPLHNLFLIIFFALSGGFSSAAAQTSGNPLALPVKYDEHRFYVQPVTRDGVTLNFFTDTGGGLLVFSDVVERLKLPVTKIKTDEGASDTVKLPAFKPDASIPAPPANDGILYVVPAKERNPMSQDWSGMLGQQWFAGRTWTFDYPKKSLLLRADGDVPKQTAEHLVALGFQTSGSGKRKTNFPRIQITIDGEPTDLLFDTGASTVLTDEALISLNDKRRAVRATSFITASVFEKWRKKHPEWRVVETAEKGSGQSMVEVPQILVAGYAVGPVWFTRRPDKNFHEYMSQWMDKRIDGALGGNALRFFRITVDYPRAVAVFEK